MEVPAIGKEHIAYKKAIKKKNNMIDPQWELNTLDYSQFFFQIEYSPFLLIFLLTLELFKMGDSVRC